MSNKMKNIHQNEEGFIPMMLAILAIVIAIIIFVYLQVSNAA
jgi:hypothetical protein